MSARYCNEYVCSSVGLSAGTAYLRNHTAELYQISVHVVCGHGSVFLRRHCDMLSSSSFVDDVMFSHDGLGASVVHIAYF